ncbi:MAG: metal-dependent hydrolase [Hyphomicrobiaceae bacterium]|nr:metal-dependent hydrolase [Hyphomicrobiaceae bacterium]MCC0024006.1 metal-dependent hydrolase [Hyphomicrobiaceae bacterium]
MQIQWLGHSAFKITDGETRVLIDPFLNGNPKFTGDYEATVADVTHVLLTHMHNDHFGDSMDILRKTKAKLVALVEIADWVGGKLGMDQIVDFNFGGTVEVEGIRVSLVPAVHTSGLTMEDGTAVFGGTSAGLIVEMGGHRIYHMGDTTIFGDMALIEELHHPDIGIVPIGGHFTMDAKVAALAVNRYFNFKIVLPCHYLTFPLLAQSADEFVEGVQGPKVLTLAPMESVEV